MSNPIIRYGTSSYTFDGIVRPNYPNNLVQEYYTDLAQNPEYGLTNRDLPSTEVSWEVSDIKQTVRNLFWTLWESTLLRGSYLFTLMDNKKRFLFDVFWPQWKERWNKRRGGTHQISFDLLSAYPWTPPMFAFYPFWNGPACHSLDTSSDLSLGVSGLISNRMLSLFGTEGVAASNTNISWLKQKGNSSISFILQFKSGELNSGKQLDIVKLSDDDGNILRIFMQPDNESSSTPAESSSAGLSSSSSSEGLSSSSSLGLSSSVGLSSSSLGLSSSSSSLGLSSSVGLSSSSSAGLSSSQGLSSSSGAVDESSSSQGLSSSLQNSSSSSSVGLSSSAGYSSSSMCLSSSSNDSGLGIEICLGWTKAGFAEEIILMSNINLYSGIGPAWYDLCGTFDNINNQFHLYIVRSGNTSVGWSQTMDFLYGTTSLISIPENCLVSDLTPTNYPEDITWKNLYLLRTDDIGIYADANRATLKFAMIIDEFVSPTEFNWIRRLFHSWVKTGGDLPV